MMNPPGSQEPPQFLKLLAEKDAPAVEVAPHKQPTTPREWLKENLFSGPINSVLTLVIGVATAYILFGILRWVFVRADFTVMKANFRIAWIGRFPIDEAWRVWVAWYMTGLLAGFSWGASGKRLLWNRTRLILRIVLALLLVAALGYFLDGVRVWVLTLGLPASVLAGIALGRLRERRLRRSLVIAWLLWFPAFLLILRGFGGVSPNLWGGFTLNFLVAVISIFASFPLGILLALGRRSSLPAVRLFCVGFIELVRGAPLFGWLLISINLLPLVLPPGLVLNPILRIMIIFTFFSAVYVAEIVRGGLQGVAVGQFEAAKALGLPGRKMQRLVILPQALRNTIPAMISHFISLFKDTSLMAGLAILELLRASRRAAGQLEFLGHTKEALLVAAIIFWVVAFSMSRWSQRLERRLGVGER